MTKAIRNGYGFDELKLQTPTDCCEECGATRPTKLYENAPKGHSAREQLCDGCITRLYGSLIVSRNAWNGRTSQGMLGMAEHER